MRLLAQTIEEVWETSRSILEDERLRTSLLAAIDPETPDGYISVGTVEVPDPVTPVVREVVEKGEAGVFVPPGDPAALAEATRVSLGIVRDESWRRDRLHSLIERFRAGAGEIGLRLMPSRTPIQPILLGEADAAVAWSRRLEELGFLVTAIRPPTVPAGQARLRVTFSASHDEEQVDRLLDALSILQREFAA